MGKIYPEDIKKKAVELYRLDDKTTYAEVGRDLGGISGETVRNWCHQADRDEGRRNDGGSPPMNASGWPSSSAKSGDWRRRTGS